MRIEPYKAGGKRYYRVVNPPDSPIHLGTAEAILRKMRPERLRSEEENQKTPRIIPKEEPEEPHEPPDSTLRVGPHE